MKNLIKKINHIAIVAPDLDSTMGFWVEALGLHISGSHREEKQGADVTFLPAGESNIEIVVPFMEDSGVAKYLQKRGPGMHHLCLEVEDIDAALTRLKEYNVPLINEEPQVNSEGVRLAFIHPKGTGGVLVELYEVKE